MATNSLLALLAVLAVLGVACAPGPAPATSTSASADAVPVTTRLTYGADRSQFVDVTVPTSPGPHPTVAFVHGGFWYDGYGADLMDALVRDARDRGWAVANLEYRRVNGGGGWPETFEDVAAALDLLVGVDGVDPDRIAVVGHSAGGHLALWAAGRSLLPAGAPGADPQLRPCAAVGQAPVADLAAAYDDQLGGGAALALLEARPDEDPARWANADPIVLTGHDVPVLLTHGTGDRVVPYGQSEAYAATQSTAELGPFDGGHFDVLDPAKASWQQTAAYLVRTCGFPAT